MAKDLNKLSPDELGNLFPIIITEYNPDWKNLFNSEKETIKKAVGVRNLLRVEHIGSTAIPGICAKPTIDILLEIKDNTDTESIITDLKNIGYFFTPKPENPPPHMMFMKGYSNNGFTGQAFHIHVRYKGDWDELVFRDYLIQNYKTAQEYGKLKLRLAAEYINDREKYTNNKSDFITRITKMARKETKN